MKAVRRTPAIVEKTSTCAAHLAQTSEWLNAGPWRLPSGKLLGEFALQGGFLAPVLLKNQLRASLCQGSVEGIQ